MKINVIEQSTEDSITVRTGTLSSSASKLIKSLKTNEMYWDEATQLAMDAPYIFMSPRYALKDASEKIAEGMEEGRAQSFLKYAYKRYGHLSNYAGD